MQRNTLMRLALALCVAATLMLAGCGGDDGATAPSVPDPDPALIAAQAAAKDAYDAAKTARDAARNALADAEENKDADLASYRKAENALMDAETAYEAAEAANAAARMAMTAADAGAAQADAEAAQEDAEAAQANAEKYAGMVTAAYMAAVEMKALTAAQAAAMTAYDAAKAANTAAQAALAGVEAIKDADMPSYDMAMAAAAAAQMAYDAAAAANTAAMEATDSATAKAEQAKAEQAKMDAEAAQANAMMYAGMVKMADDTRMAEAEKEALTAARSATMTAYEATRTALNAARNALADAEANKDADIASYTKAANAVSNAESAYEAAMAANAAAQAAADSATAQAEQAKAEAAKTAAEAAQADAVKYAGMVADAYMAAVEAKALSAAQAAAMTAYDGAKAALAAAKQSLAGVEAIKDADMASYDMAVAAVAAAQTAYDAAKAANTAAMEAADSDAAKAAQADAEQAETDAEAAQANAMKYAGMVQTADDERVAAAEAVALGAAQLSAKAALDATQTAYEAARDALAGLLGKSGHDPVAYNNAQNEVNSAWAAYQEALAANTLAQRAMTSAEAKRHQETAEDARADAETARDNAIMYAGVIDQAIMDKAAAMTAMTDAKAEYEAAKQALADIDGQQADDMDSYNMAMAELGKAQAAYEAAKSASEMAQAATSAEDAAKYMQMAQDELAKAQTANTNAMKYAGMVTDAYNIAEGKRMEVNAARMAASTAADDAKMAYEAAKKVVADIEDKKDDNIEDYVRAMDARDRAEAAYMAAKSASEMADATDDPAMAEQHKMTAEAERDKAKLAETGAKMYANLVDVAYTAAQGQRDRDADEVEALADAKQAAMDAATKARTAASAAREQATKVAELLGPTSQAAMDADAAATAAEMAATAAEEASARAQDDTTSADAMAEQQTAEGKQSDAEMKLADATELARQAGVSTAGLDQLRIELARDDAKDAKEAAAKAAAAAREKANMADEQADAAEEAALKAKRARTNYVEANKKAMAARTAAIAADTAADAAETASGMADDEYMKTTPEDVTVDEARMARNNTRGQRDTAMDENGKANTGYMDAMNAAADAMMYVNRHVISLLIHANAQDLDLGDPDDVDVAASLEKAKEDRLKAVSGVIGGAAVGNNNSADDTGASDTTAAASWAVDTAADPDADPPVEFEAGAFSIAVDTDGVGATPVLQFTTEAAEEDDDTTADVDESIKTATKLRRGLGDFMHGYQIEHGTRHAIVFTDITQTVAGVAAVTLGEPVDIDNKPVTASQVVLAEDATDLTGATYDHDGDPDTDGLTATFACGSATPIECSLEIVGGELRSLVGYVVDVDVGADFLLKAAVAEMPDSDYLVFGVWLQEQVLAGDGSVQTPLAFAAFADGVDPVEGDLTPVTGEAKYNGKATGVYTAGDSVDYFEGAAALTAKFGPMAADTAADPPITDNDALGSITGSISGIVAGGEPMSDVINLRSAQITAAGAFSGATRMGVGVIQDDDTVKYPYNGMWSGNFYNGADLEDGNPDLSEAPGAAAGTFGVTGTMGEGDDAMTRSYVGAFGAHKP